LLDFSWWKKFNLIYNLPFIIDYFVCPHLPLAASFFFFEKHELKDISTV